MLCLFFLTNWNYWGGKKPKTRCKELQGNWVCEIPYVFYFDVFYFYHLKKFHSNFCNLTPSFSLSLWSPLAGSIQNWNLNLIVSLSRRIFSVSEKKIWDTKFWVYLRSCFLKRTSVSSKANSLINIKKKKNLTRFLNSKSDFTASIFFLNWKENQLLKIMISPRHYSSLFFNSMLIYRYHSWINPHLKCHFKCWKKEIWGGEGVTMILIQETSLKESTT